MTGKTLAECSVEELEPYSPWTIWIQKSDSDKMSKACAERLKEAFMREYKGYEFEESNELIIQDWLAENIIDTLTEQEEN